MRNIHKGFILGVCFFMLSAGFLGARAFALENKAAPVVEEIDGLTPEVIAHLKEVSEKYKDDGQNEIVLKNGVVFHPHAYEIISGSLWLKFKGHDTAPENYEMAMVLSLIDVETINKTEVDPAEAYFGMATFYLNEGKDLNKAISNLEKTILLNPNHKLALIDLGSAYNHAGRFADSLELGKKAVELYPDNQKLWFNLGVAYVKEGPDSKAEECYARALRLDPDFGEAYGNWGMLLFDLGRMEEAKTKLEAAKRLVDKTADPQILDTMEKVLAEIAKEEDIYRVLEMAAAGQFKEARAYLEQGRNPRLAEFQWGCFLSVLKDLEQGVVSPEYGKYFFQGMIAYRKQDLNKAIGEFEKAIGVNNKVPHAPFFLATTYVMLEQLEAAVPHFEETIKLKPDFVEAYWGLASAYETLKDVARAQKNYEKARAIFVERKNDPLVKIIDEQLARLLKQGEEKK